MGQIKGQESRGQSPQLSFKVSLPGEGWRQISMSDEGSVQIRVSVHIRGQESKLKFPMGGVSIKCLR